jgi:hypothetical protein
MWFPWAAALSELRVIRPESGSLGYSADLKRSVSESAVFTRRRVFHDLLGACRAAYDHG